jgi:glycosyltransferase involved in cell wall biosynthesis
MRSAIEKKIEVVGSKDVVYLGYQDHSELGKTLSASDVYVLPSSIEGFPLAILEAMAMRVVPIASRVGGVPDIIESPADGFVVTPGSAEEIADAIVAMKNDEVLLGKLKKRVRQKIQDKYSSRVLGLSYKNLYRSVLKGK